MTTNGTLLPKKIDRLKEAGLNHINISLDSLVEAKNQFITRRPVGFQQTLSVLSHWFNLIIVNRKSNRVEI